MYKTQIWGHSTLLPPIFGILGLFGVLPGNFIGLVSNF